MSEQKKKVSFDDFVADEDALTTDDNLNEDQDDLNQDDLEDKAQKDKKKAAKGQPKPKDESDDEDEDLDDSDTTDDVVKPKEKDKKPVDKAKDKKKVEPDVVIGDDQSDEPEPEGDEPDAGKFFEEVEKITGSAVEVDYGDVDPLTPQGIALRDKALKEQTLDSFLEEIEAKFPQAFKALQHAYNGGDISELFTQTTGRDYSKIELKEGDDATAKQVLTEYFKSKGIKSEQRIAKLIESYEDSEEGLFKEAEAALDELKKEQDAQTTKLVEIQKQKAAEQKKKDQVLVAAVDEVLEARKLGGFRITDRQEATEFKKFVMTNLRRTGEGGYELAMSINPTELEKQLQYAYFQYKKGDLSKIVREKATTENAKKLSLRLASEQQKQKKTTEQESKIGSSMKDFYTN